VRRIFYKFSSLVSERVWKTLVRKRTEKERNNNKQYQSFINFPLLSWKEFGKLFGEKEDRERRK